jgi:hypothetical protein
MSKRDAWLLMFPFTARGAPGELLEDVAEPIRAKGHQVHLPTFAANRSRDSKKIGLDDAIASLVAYCDQHRINDALRELRNTLTTLEATRPEPGLYDQKIYAPGIGMVLERRRPGRSRWPTVPSRHGLRLKRRHPIRARNKQEIAFEVERYRGRMLERRRDRAERERSVTPALPKNSAQSSLTGTPRRHSHPPCRWEESR